jgi:hypothetical protein
VAVTFVKIQKIKPALCSLPTILVGNKRAGGFGGDFLIK